VAARGISAPRAAVLPAGQEPALGHRPGGPGGAAEAQARRAGLRRGTPVPGTEEPAPGRRPGGGGAEEPGHDAGGRAHPLQPSHRKPQGGGGRLFAAVDQSDFPVSLLGSFSCWSALPVPGTNSPCNGSRRR
jgi:hypothetical protein